MGKSAAALLEDGIMNQDWSQIESAYEIMTGDPIKSPLRETVNRCTTWRGLVEKMVELGNNALQHGIGYTVTTKLLSGNSNNKVNEVAAPKKKRGRPKKAVKDEFTDTSIRGIYQDDPDDDDDDIVETIILDKVEKRIKDDFDLLPEAGEDEVEASPIVEPVKASDLKKNDTKKKDEFYIEQGQTKSDGKSACKRVPFQKGNQKLGWKDNPQFEAKLVAETKAMNATAGPKDYRPPAQKIDVQCDGCGKKTKVYPADLPVRVASDDDTPKWKCDSCIRNLAKRD